MWEWLKAKFSSAPHPRGYEIGQRVFEGAFSDIYKAVQKKTGQQVALKILTEAGAKIARLLDEDDSTMWEGELLANLHHPNIVKGLDYGKNSKYWLVMEIIKSNLPHYIGRCNDEEEEKKIIDILSQIIAAIHYLHDRDLVHRDICLGNVLLDPSGTVKLIDFGMTVPVGSKVVKGRVGTPSYMAPEMIKRWQYTPATDIYSFGIVMYELITGKKPFHGRRREQRMTHSLNLHPTPPSEDGYHCSEDVEELLMQCISKDPEKRPDSAREVANTLCVIRYRRGMDSPQGSG